MIHQVPKANRSSLPSNTRISAILTLGTFSSFLAMKSSIFVPGLSKLKNIYRKSVLIYSFLLSNVQSNFFCQTSESTYSFSSMNSWIYFSIHITHLVPFSLLPLKQPKPTTLCFSDVVAIVFSISLSLISPINFIIQLSLDNIYFSFYSFSCNLLLNQFFFLLSLGHLKSSYSMECEKFMFSL